MNIRSNEQIGARGRPWPGGQADGDDLGDVPRDWSTLAGWTAGWWPLHGSRLTWRFPRFLWRFRGKKLEFPWISHNWGRKIPNMSIWEEFQAIISGHVVNILRVSLVNSKTDPFRMGKPMPNHLWIILQHPKRPSKPLLGIAYSILQLSHKHRWSSQKKTTIHITYYYIILPCPINMP